MKKRDISRKAKLAIEKEKKDGKRDAALKGKMVLVRIFEPHVIWEKISICTVRAGALALMIATDDFLFVANAADKYNVAEIAVVVIKAKGCRCASCTRHYFNFMRPSSTKTGCLGSCCRKALGCNRERGAEITV